MVFTLIFVSVAIVVYQVYEPYLDIIGCPGERWLVVWYNPIGSGKEVRQYKKILKLDGTR